MEWCVRQKHAEKSIEWGNVSREARLGPAWKEHDGSLMRDQEFSSGIIGNTEALNVLYAPEHHRKRFFHAPLSFAKQIDCGVGTRVTSKMKATQSLHGDNGVLLQKARRLAKRFRYVEREPSDGPQLQLWPAVPAGVWLRVETPIGGSSYSAWHAPHI